MIPLGKRVRVPVALVVVVLSVVAFLLSMGLCGAGAKPGSSDQLTQYGLATFFIAIALFGLAWVVGVVELVVVLVRKARK